MQPLLFEVNTFLAPRSLRALNGMKRDLTHKSWSIKTIGFWSLLMPENSKIWVAVSKSISATINSSLTISWHQQPTKTIKSWSGGPLIGRSTLRARYVWESAPKSWPFLFQISFSRVGGLREVLMTGCKISPEYLHCKLRWWQRPNYGLSLDADESALKQAFSRCTKEKQVYLGRKINKTCNCSRCPRPENAHLTFLIQSVSGFHLSQHRSPSPSPSPSPFQMVANVILL